MAAVTTIDDPPNDLLEQVHVTNPVLDSAVVDDVKIVAEHVKQEDNSPLASSRGPSLSTSPDHASDAASVHSMPAVHVSESAPSDARRPSTSASNAPVPHPSSRPPSAPQSPIPQQENTPTALSQQQRRARHRSAIEVCPLPSHNIYMLMKAFSRFVQLFTGSLNQQALRLLQSSHPSW